MQEVPRDAKPFEDLLFRNSPYRIDLLQKPGIAAISTEQMAEQEEQVLIHKAAIITITIQADRKRAQPDGQSGLHRMQRLKKLRHPIAGKERVLQKSIVRSKKIMKDRRSKLLFKEHGESPGAHAGIDPARVVLIVVQDEELAGANGDGMTVDMIPFLAGENGLQRETADMIGTPRSPAKGVEDHVLLSKPVKMCRFIETRGTMVG